MKILVTTSTFPRWRNDTDPGFVYELSKRFIDNDTCVHVLAPHTKGAAENEELDGLIIHRYRYFIERFETLAYGGGILDKLRATPLNYALIPFFVLGMVIAVWRLQKRERFDVIHAHWLIPQGFACAVALLFAPGNARLVTTSHGGDLFGLRGKIPVRIKRWVLAKSAKVTVVSHYMKDFLIENVCKEARPEVMSMGVDLSNRFVIQEKVERQDNSVIFVGRLVEKKGVTYLLEAFAEVREKVADCRLTIVGGGPLQGALEQQCERLRIDDAVTFVGSVTQEQLPALYCAAKIAVVPSVVAESGDQEGLGLVTVEALACGCAVVASDLPAIRDVVTHGKNGILAEPKNVSALADALNTLLLDPNELRRYQAAARPSVVDRFDWMAIANEYRNLLKLATQSPL